MTPPLSSWATNRPPRPTFPSTPSSSAGSPNTEHDLLASVPAALAVAQWQQETLEGAGPVVLFDATWPGTHAAGTDHARLALGPGRYAVRAAQVSPGPETWLVLVQLRPLP